MAGSSFHRDRRGVELPVGAGLGGAGRRKGREARGGVDVELRFTSNAARGELLPTRTMAASLRC